LAEQDRAAEQKRINNTLAHPLTQAVMQIFPGSQLTALRQKTVAAPAVVSDSAEGDVIINDEPTNLTEDDE
jgi:hypothetical protein